MNEEEILVEFSRILGALLSDNTIDLKMDTLRSDIPAWDSFQYVNFIVAAELELGVKYRVADVESFRTVGDIVNETKALLG